MPEGHTIHRLAQDIGRDLAGAKVGVSSPQGRFEGATAVDGAVLRGTSAIGKHLFLHFEAGTVHVHLGLFGKFRREKSPPPEPRGALRMRLVGAERTWDLRGPTACEILDDAGLERLRARLGDDPLAHGADPEAAWSKVSRTRRSLGAILLDQSVFAGLGNVYRAEILFLLRLHPETPGLALDRATFDALWDLSKRLLARGVREKRIVTRDAPKGVRLRRHEALHVYKKSRCDACGSAIRKLMSAARAIYVCERCQPPPRAPAAPTLTPPAGRPPRRNGPSGPP